ncbi:hypothetical protein [Erysipelothrix aquatica]|uniref:hypothetical protein n=1 Tax=Erysipelothrix aquatica TaxID=2683714 RepID=UPI00135B4A05|nr:hypothetical protein [Erysipelothrix aquatica]
MEALKKWIRTKNGKIITGVVFVAVILSGITIAALLQNKSVDYQLEYAGKDNVNIVVEYGSSIKNEDITSKFVLKGNGELVDTNKFTILVDSIKSDTVSYKMTDKQRLTMATADIFDLYEFHLANMNENGGGKPTKYEVKAFDGAKEIASTSFDVIVVDTVAPTIDPIEDIETEIGTPIEFTNKFKAKDPVDGDIEVKVEGDVDYSVAGKTELKAVATDKHGNKTELAFNVIVKDKEAEESLPETGNNGNTSSNNGGASNDGGSSNGGGSTSNGNSSNSGGTNSGGTNSGGGNITQPEKPKPVEPTVPTYQPGDYVGDGLYFYRYYGTYESCAAVMQETLFSDVGENWRSNMCASDGAMLYTKR